MNGRRNMDGVDMHIHHIMSIWDIFLDLQSILEDSERETIETLV